MGQKLKFSDGEKVLCFHGPLIYEAKCLKSSITKDKLVKYFIHYAGWNKNWDEWVPESRVLKYNDANVQRQKEVQRTHKANRIRSSGKKSRTKKAEAAVEEAGTSTPVKEETPKSSKNKDRDTLNDSSSETPKKKRGRVEQTVESVAKEEPEKLQVKITLPDDLKQILTNDWHLVVNQHKLVNLPAKPTITQIFDTYAKTAKLTEDEDVAAMEGIKDYFNFSLSKQLLYEAEQTQFKSLDVDTAMCDVYGLVHLLRMFTKFGTMLVYLQMDEKTQVFILDFIKKFLVYVSDNKSEMLSSEDYISKST